MRSPRSSVTDRGLERNYGETRGTSPRARCEKYASRWKWLVALCGIKNRGSQLLLDSSHHRIAQGGLARFSGELGLLLKVLLALGG